MVEEHWLTRAGRRAEEHLLSMPYNALSPVGKQLVDRIKAERVQNKTHLRLVRDDDA